MRTERPIAGIIAVTDIGVRLTSVHGDEVDLSPSHWKSQVKPEKDSTWIQGPLVDTSFALSYSTRCYQKIGSTREDGNAALASARHCCLSIAKVFHSLHEAALRSAVRER